MDNVKCIIGVVERGKADLVVNGAKAAGATGATIFFARGERVIIVTGCINALKSRVLGTGVKYNSCIA